MSDPQDPPRLLGDPDGPAALRAGLEEMRAAEIPADARDRLARSIGIAPTPSGAGGGGGTTLPAVAKVGIALGVLGAGAVIWWATHRAPPAAPTAPPPPPSTLVVEAPAPPPPIDTAPPPSAAPSASTATVTPIHAVTTAAPAKSVEAPKPDEATLFRNAGDALRAGNAARALELGDEQASRFPDGTFAQEREVLRIDALAALGRNDEARDHARSFLAQHPESAHRPRLERMLAK